MTHSTRSSRAPFALPLALALTLAGVPTSALAGQPDPAPTAAPVVVEPAPVAEPAPIPAPVLEPAPMPQPLPPAPVAPPPKSNRGLGLMIAGLGVFTFSYLITAATGAVIIDTGNKEVGEPLLIPIVGPFIDIGRTGSATAGIGLAFAGIVQLAGFGMAVGGGALFGISRARSRSTALMPSPYRSARLVRDPRRLVLAPAPGGLALRF